ncbi:MAG TPA: hypothetical protein VG099_31850 [Gemmataceae bacterium]|jgi:hypothetical protein|nr:hypothetical protein [Gemmataceae bacterium]
MRFSVNWLPDCEQELAHLWINAPDRQAVTQAAHILDERLRLDPLNAGESRPSGRRILFASPLGVVYRVIPDDMLVQVEHVWRFD